MKQRFTTPSSASFTTKTFIAASVVLLAIVGPLSLAMSSQNVYADSFDNQKTALNQQIGDYQAQENALSQQLTSLQAQLQLLNVQKSQIETEIQLTQTEYDQLTTQIQNTQKQIDAKRKVLGEIIAQMYVDGRVTPLEMLASSNNISTYLNQQAYQIAIQNTVTATINKIQDLKKQQQKQQADVQTTLDKQKAQENSLVAKVAQQNQLITQTQGQQSQYQQLVAQAQQRLKAASAEQQTYYKGLAGAAAYGVHGSFSYSNWSGNQGCGGGYPYCGAQDSSVDPWGLFNRECVSYVAWGLANRFHRNVANFNGAGDAGQWPQSAAQYSGATVDQTPQAGDAAILPATSDDFAPIGHAMLVESVSGSTVHVSQYNFYGTGEYSTMDIGTGGVVFLRFPPAS